MERRPVEPADRQPQSLSLGRRAFIFGAAATIYTAVEATKRLGPPLVGQVLASRNSLQSNDSFLAEHRDRLQHVALGGTFLLEEFVNPGDADFDKKYKLALRCLDYAVDTLGITTLRVGIQWDHAEKDLGFYQQFLDRCQQKGVQLCVAVGPIKTPRWPEEHVPESVSHPPTDTTIEPGSPIVNPAMVHLERVLEQLKPYERSIRVIQPENEPFNHFGEPVWSMGAEYMEQVVRRIHNAFPDKKILINGSGAKESLFGEINALQIADFFRDLVASDESYRGKLVLGIDAYHTIPNTPPTDTVTNMEIEGGTGIFGELHQLAHDEGYEIEVTELQFEPWGDKTKPGNSAADLQFSIDRALDIVDPTNANAYIGLWGLERFVRARVTQTMVDDPNWKEHRRIEKLITAITSLRKKK